MDMDNFNAMYEAMVQANFDTITHVNCRRRNSKNCYHGKLLTESVYAEDGTMETAHENYLGDGTLGDDGSIVCDACYCGF